MSVVVQWIRVDTSGLYYSSSTQILFLIKLVGIRPGLKVAVLPRRIKFNLIRQ